MSVRIETAIEALRAGQMVVLVDSQSREHEGDLVFAAEKVTPELVNFMMRFARGVVCVPMQGDDLDRLSVPLMPARNASRFACQFTVSVDAASGISTGVSAADRARTIEVIANPESVPEDISTPGHVFPIRSHPLGILGRQGHTEGSLALMSLAGLHPCSVICEIVNDDGTMARMDALQAFSLQYDCPLIAMDAVVARYQSFRKRSSVPCVRKRFEQ